MITIPLKSTPRQLVRFVADGKNWQLLLYTKTNGLFADLNVDGVTISAGVLCENKTNIIGRLYAGVTGMLGFVDTVSDTPPDYSGFENGRYLLIYMTDAEL